jgi:hypothetical protein
MTTGTGRSAGGGGGAVPATVGQLRASGWADRTVKQEVAAWPPGSPWSRG